MENEGPQLLYLFVAVASRFVTLAGWYRSSWKLKSREKRTFCWSIEHPPRAFAV